MTTTRQLDTMQTASFTNLHAMCSAYAHRFLLQHGDAITPRHRAILEARDVLVTSVPDMAHCVKFSSMGAECVLRKADGVSLY